MSPQPIRAHTARSRTVLAATVLASGMVFLDGSVVNIADREIPVVVLQPN